MVHNTSSNIIVNAPLQKTFNENIPNSSPNTIAAIFLHTLTDFFDSEPGFTKCEEEKYRKSEYRKKNIHSDVLVEEDPGIRIFQTLTISWTS